jgi:NAD(P)-dependent dehydrogenase (short-subunit alcohol dehydrogenase family)
MANGQIPQPGPVDRLLDWTIAPGFTKIGYAIRSRSFDPLPDATGRTIVVTGASTGLGLATSKMCARAGASVVMISRDPARGEEALEKVKQEASEGAAIDFEACDLADLASVRKLGRSLAKRLDRIDALVLNAGVLLQQRDLSADGVERAWATNVVGPYLLEALLLDRIAESNGRVVLVTSGGAYSERLALPEADAAGDTYDGPAVYARTKRAQISLARLQAEQFADLGVSVHAVHPGWADTPGVQTSLPTFRKLTAPVLRNADQGADTIAWLALAEEPASTSGLLWHDRKPRSRHRVPGQEESRKERLELDATLADLTGVPARRG